MAEGEKNSKNADQTKPVDALLRAQGFSQACVAQKTERVFLFAAGWIGMRVEIRCQGHLILRALDEQRGAAPDQHNHYHDRGDGHDLDRLVAGFMNAEQILPKEINGDAHGNGHRAPRANGIAGCLIYGDAGKVRDDLQTQADEVLARRHRADRSG